CAARCDLAAAWRIGEWPRRHARLARRTPGASGRRAAELHATTTARSADGRTETTCGAGATEPVFAGRGLGRHHHRFQSAPGGDSDGGHAADERSGDCRTEGP